MVTRGFTGRQQSPDIAKRLPPGQSLTADFPVLSAGPTPHISFGDWSFTLKVGPKPVAKWNWAEFNALPKTHQIRDIHCVTKWSKLDTPWDGVLVTTCSKPPASRSRRPSSSWRTPSTVIPLTCRSPISSAARR